MANACDLWIFAIKPKKAKKEEVSNSDLFDENSEPQRGNNAIN